MGGNPPILSKMLLLKTRRHLHTLKFSSDLKKELIKYASLGVKSSEQDKNQAQIHFYAILAMSGPAPLAG